MLTLFAVSIPALGLFLFVANALLFWLVAEIVGGFRVTGFGAALVGSILTASSPSLTSWLLLPRTQVKLGSETISVR